MKEVWSKAYFPASEITNNPGAYEGHVEFRHVCICLTFLNELQLGCGLLLSWLHEKWCIYMIEIDHLCIWQCLVILKGSSITGQEWQKTRWEMLSTWLVKFYGNPNLHVHDIRPTKLINFENISLRFQVNVRLYEPILGNSYATNPLVWKLVFEQVQHRRSLSSINIKGTASTFKTWTS